MLLLEYALFCRVLFTIRDHRIDEFGKTFRSHYRICIYVRTIEIGTEREGERMNTETLDTDQLLVPKIK